MSYLNEKVAPRREERLKSFLAYGGSACELQQQTAAGCLRDGERCFNQTSLCQLLPSLAILLSVPETVIIVHGSLGCGASALTLNSNIRGGQAQRGAVRPKDAIWISTNLDENDVINGGEKKLEEAIVAADRRFRPEVILVVGACVPGIIGDDIDSVVDRLRPDVSATLLPVHCEGFKTKIWASGYDAIYHSVLNNLVEPPAPDEITLIPDNHEHEEKFNNRRSSRSCLVNLLNNASTGRPDEVELERLLQALGLEVNIIPDYAHPDKIRKVTEAALTISICPTHDDYFVKHLEERYGIPYIIRRLPVGMANTSEWVLDVARFFDKENEARQLIEAEEKVLNEALVGFRQALKGKRVLLSAGQFRAIATASLCQELGMEVVGTRLYHHDDTGQDQLDALTEDKKDFQANVANFQPFELTNLALKLKPDFFIGHIFDNVWAAKLGLPVLTIFRIPYNYLGYRGVYDVARRIVRQLKNPNFNRQVGRHARHAYTDQWLNADPYECIVTPGGEQD